MTEALNCSNLNTPAVLIDRTVVERNIHKFQHYCTQHKINLRPHIKTHKLVELAQLQVAAGAVGINCQKLSEAEVMAANGFDDILITYNILGEVKLTRLVALAKQVNKLTVTADSEVTVQGLAAAFMNATKPLEVLVECDTGGQRCGVQSPEAAVTLAKLISEAPGLVFGGLMTYPAKGGASSVQTFMTQTKKLLQTATLPCKTITSGGSPDMWHAANAPVITEYRVGTYIYNDRSLVARKSCSWEDCALSVLTTVVSVPTPGRAIIDAGSKILGADLMGLDGYGKIVDHPAIKIIGLNEEHGILTYPPANKPLAVGQLLRVIPNHVCVVSNLVNEVTFIRNDKIEKTLRVDARGCIT